MTYSLNHGQLLRDGAAMLVLTRAHYGDGAPPQAELDALEQQIVKALNAALRKPKRATTVDLTAPIKVGRRAKHWGEFVIQWADGSDTLVRGVTYDDPRDRWAAAFQAADRLRRQRGRHAAWAEIGAPPRWTDGPMGVRIQTPAYEDYCRTRPLPAAVAILADDGETFSVGSAT